VQRERELTALKCLEKEEKPNYSDTTEKKNVNATSSRRKNETRGEKRKG